MTLYLNIRLFSLSSEESAVFNIMAKKKPLVDFDEKEAFNRASDFEYEFNPYVTPELQEFMRRKAKKHGVKPSMAIPSFLTVTSNLMGKAEVRVACIYILSNDLWLR